jgi:hypothetical protein
MALAAAEAAEPADRVGSGRIAGGWGYVWASYGLTWAMMIGYGLYLWVRREGGSREG